MIEATNMGKLLEACAGQHDRGITFIKGKREEDFISYASIYNEALALLYGLQAKNLQPGDEVILQVEDNRNFVTAFWACLMGGLIPVPLSIGNNDESRSKVFSVWKILHRPYLITDKGDIDYLTKFHDFEPHHRTHNQMGDRTVFISEIQSLSGQGVIYHPESGDTAFIQFSSGSTGEPKGVVLTHLNLLANIEAIISRAQIKLEDSGLSWLPLTHDMGMIGCHLAWIAVNAQQYIMPTALFIRHPLLWFEKAHEHKVTCLVSPNFGYKYFLDALKPDTIKDWDLSKIRLIFNGAEAISISLCKKFLKEMARYKLNRQVMFPVYGLAEACLGVAFPVPGEALVVHHLNRESLAVGEKIVVVSEAEAANCISFVEEGYPILYCQVRVCNCDNQELSEKTIGRIQICGQNVTRGYYNDSSATAEVMTLDGWLDTGDLGFINNGRLTVTGRAKEIILINGQNFYPHDIERVAEGVSEIELGEVSACGVLDEKLQIEELIIFVRFKKKIEQFIPLARKVKQQISSHMGLEVKTVIPLKHMPKTTSGKIKHNKLAERYMAGEFRELSEQIQKLLLLVDKDCWEPGELLSRTEGILAGLCAEVLGKIPLGIDDSFIEFDTNSVVLSNIYQRLNEFYPNRFTIATLFDHPTIAKLAAFIDQDGAQAFEPLFLPENYFNKTAFAQEGATFQFELDENLSAKIRGVAGELELGCSELLLILCLILCQKEFGTEKVTLHSAFHEKQRLTPITVDFGCMSNRQDLDHFVKQAGQENTGSYSLEKLNPLLFLKKKNGVLPLFYKPTFVSIDEALLEYFEIAIGIDEGAAKIAITCDFNHHRLAKEKMLGLLQTYLMVIKKSLGI